MTVYMYFNDVCFFFFIQEAMMVMTIWRSVNPGFTNAKLLL